MQFCRQCQTLCLCKECDCRRCGARAGNDAMRETDPWPDGFVRQNQSSISGYPSDAHGKADVVITFFSLHGSKGRWRRRGEIWGINTEKHIGRRTELPQRTYVHT